MDLFSKPKNSEEKALSVTQLLRRMKNLLEVQIGEMWVEGEVSNLRKQASGHWYFSLKDEGAQISCAMFGAKKREGSESLEDGVKVRVFAEASVYEARGQLQIIVQKAERAGAGDLQARFELLKRKLLAEGLFDSDRKKAIPKFPHVIGIITSGTGAALQDIINVLTRRAPWVQVVLFPVRVQGRGAEMEIALAIEKMGDPEAFGYPRCEVIIVGVDRSKTYGILTRKSSRERSRRAQFRLFPQWAMKLISPSPTLWPICGRPHPALRPNWQFPMALNCSHESGRCD